MDPFADAVFFGSVYVEWWFSEDEIGIRIQIPYGIEVESKIRIPYVSLVDLKMRIPYGIEVGLKIKDLIFRTLDCGT